MANNFINYPARNVGTATVTLFTVAAATQATVIGLSIANVTTNAIKASLLVTIGGLDYFLVKDADIPPGSALVPYGGDQKLALATGAALKVSTSVANGADVLASVLNIT